MIPSLARMRTLALNITLSCQGLTVFDLQNYPHVMHSNSVF